MEALPIDECQSLTTAQIKRSSWVASNGSPVPLGVSHIESLKACNFAIYSKNASRVVLLFFSKTDLVNPIFRYVFDTCHNRTGRIWHALIPEEQVRQATYYAYSVDGPPPTGRQHEWNDFKPAKLLLDPFATCVYYPPTYDREAARGTGSNIGKAILGVLPRLHERFDWESDAHPSHSGDLVIYEMHVGGFTKNPNSGLQDPAKRGTFAGIIEKIPYLKELGITAVELMPVFSFDETEPNYWGYQPISFFAPHGKYAVSPEKATREFREMVKALHKADIEVILDVVYNHTGEDNEKGPTFSLKGIDSSTYYMDSPDPNNPYPYQDYTACGNTLHCANPAVRQLIISSMRYWVREMHVDGFRFDLASVLTRNTDGTLNLDAPAIFGDIADDPDLAGIRLIAEPWDASNGYELGRKFPGIGWIQWNDRFRTTLRKFVKGDAECVNDMITRLYGSDDMFPDFLPECCRPFQSLNYIASHDGYSLYDLVSYNGPESWNCGSRGDLDNGEGGISAATMELRKRQVKNFCSLLMLSNGTPMFRMGDEIMLTQKGEANPYNLDSEITWMDWHRLDAFSDIFRFFQRMIAFRKSHPTLGRFCFWREDVEWFGVQGEVDRSPNSHTLAYYLDGSSQEDDSLYVMINAYWEPLEFQIAKGSSGDWVRMVDTSLPSPEDIVETETAAQRLDSLRYQVAPRSVVVLLKSKQI